MLVLAICREVFLPEPDTPSFGVAIPHVRGARLAYAIPEVGHATNT